MREENEKYRRKAKKKAVNFLNDRLSKKKKKLAKKTKTIKAVEPKENDEVKIMGFKPIIHLKTRKQLKEKAITRANSTLMQSNLSFDFETFMDKPLLFNLRMNSEFEIEDWIADNLPLGNDEFYIEHKRGSNVFRIRKELDTESNNSEMVLNNISINI